MRRLINAFLFYSHGLSRFFLLRKQSKHIHQKIKGIRQTTPVGIFAYLEKNKKKCFQIHADIFSAVLGQGNDAHNILMNLYGENYFGKCLEWLNQMNFRSSLSENFDFD